MTPPSAEPTAPLIIFDVDGTLLGGESYDWSAFEAAFLDVTGAPFTEGFFDRITEVTATSIVHTALPDRDEEALRQTILEVAAGYRDRLAVDIRKHPEAFPATQGAVELLAELKTRGYSCAIATGDWKDSIALKLNAAGIPWEELPMATSSDRITRPEIIRLAAARANRSVESAIYVGDGEWDLRATQTLEIPFIGCGKNIERLEAAGAGLVVPDLEPERFFTMLGKLTPS